MDHSNVGGDDGPGGLVSRILQVALGLFVTTVQVYTLFLIADEFSVRASDTNSKSSSQPFPHI
jgi:hypothetical protein